MSTFDEYLKIKLSYPLITNNIICNLIDHNEHNKLFIEYFFTVLVRFCYESFTVHDVLINNKIYCYNYKKNIWEPTDNLSNDGVIREKFQEIQYNITHNSDVSTFIYTENNIEDKIAEYIFDEFNKYFNENKTNKNLSFAIDGIHLFNDVRAYIYDPFEKVPPSDCMDDTYLDYTRNYSLSEPFTLLDFIDSLYRIKQIKRNSNKEIISHIYSGLYDGIICITIGFTND